MHKLHLRVILQLIVKLVVPVESFSFHNGTLLEIVVFVRCCFSCLIVFYTIANQKKINKISLSMHKITLDTQQRRSFQEKAAPLSLSYIPLKPFVHQIVHLIIGHRAVAVNPIKGRIDRDVESQPVSRFYAKTVVVISKLCVPYHLVFLRRKTAEHQFLEAIVSVRHET